MNILLFIYLFNSCCICLQHLYVCYYICFSHLSLVSYCIFINFYFINHSVLQNCQRPLVQLFLFFLTFTKLFSCEVKAPHTQYEPKYFVCLGVNSSRLERLQRIISKVQMESGICEEQLNQLESLLQTVSKTVTNSSIQLLLPYITCVHKSKSCCLESDG